MRNKQATRFLFCVLLHLPTLTFAMGDPISESKICFDSLKLFIRIMSSKLAPSNENLSLLENQKEILRNFPVRSLNKNTLVEQFLKQHKIFISLTTSPTRIRHIKNVIQTLDLTWVEEVVVALPLEYGRDKSTYVIPPELLELDKVKIIRPEKDYGPATKLLPAVEYAQTKSPKSIVITIDDDMGYPQGLVSELIFAAANFPLPIAVGSSGENLKFWGIKNKLISPKLSPSTKNLDFDYRKVDVLEGFGGVLYPAHLVNVNQIKKWGESSKVAFVSDDLVISMALQKDSVPRIKIRSDYLNRGQLLPFAYGLGSDSLHSGAGIDIQSLNPVSMNTDKYQKTFELIKNEINQ